ncbi:hypothetical protein [Dyella silvatica]|uniref:hypothetical protein n=1 Tax=Dyella silvatica TaxID=2992128 RepID=UPI00225437BA|nr:hypothetical protein [Dyella silvatica]
MHDLVARRGALAGRVAIILSWALALLLTCDGVHADNPPEGASKLAGVSFAEITALPDGQRVGMPQGGVDAFRAACEQQRPIWLLGRDRPFQCAGASESTDWMLDLPVQGLQAYTDQYVTRLVSTHEMHALPLLESDLPLRDELKAVLPPAYRAAKHTASATQGRLTLTFVLGEIYRLPGGDCRAIKTAVLATREGQATLLGELETMPHTLVDIVGVDGPLIWTDAGCTSQPASSLWRTQPTLSSVVTYVNGIEDEETTEDASPAKLAAENA